MIFKFCRKILEEIDDTMGINMLSDECRTSPCRFDNNPYEFIYVRDCNVCQHLLFSDDNDVEDIRNRFKNLKKDIEVKELKKLAYLGYL